MMLPATLARSTLAFIILQLGTGLLAAKKANRVAVRAEATKEYTLLRAQDKTAKVQTYHLIKGKYFGGNVDDPSLEDMSFPEIAEHIGLNLRRQKYFPEEDPATGDLLIMVHYGASYFIDRSGNDYDRFRNEDDRSGNGYDRSGNGYDRFRNEDDSGNYDDFWYYGKFDLDDYFPPVTTASGEIYHYNHSRNAIPDFYGFVLPSERGYVKAQYVRAKALGMDDIFKLDVTDYESSLQVELTDEGRYFIILTAFDLPLLKKGEKKVMWTTRYSIRRIGQSYAQALKELNIVAGFYFGKNIKGLISKRATDKSIVEFGEIEVIDPEAF